MRRMTALLLGLALVAGGHAGTASAADSAQVRKRPPASAAKKLSAPTTVKKSSPPAKRSARPGKVREIPPLARPGTAPRPDSVPTPPPDTAPPWTPDLVADLGTPALADMVVYLAGEYAARDTHIRRGQQFDTIRFVLRREYWRGLWNSLGHLAPGRILVLNGGGPQEPLRVEIRTPPQAKQERR